jgi:hypothetical protein
VLVQPPARTLPGAYAQIRPLGERCILSFDSSAGPPMLPLLYNNNYQIVQTNDTVLIHVEMVHDARIVRLNGIELTDREAWTKAMARGLDPIVFQTEEGEHYTAPGTLLPYERVHVDDIAPEGLDAAIAGKIARLAPVDWFRGLSLGKSHGLMVALMTYAHVSGEDLADGRHIAGTGTINGDGSVGRIGGLPSKAGAARDAGADVLVFPATQADELEDFEAAGMQLLPVLTLADAVEGLRR